MLHPQNQSSGSHLIQKQSVKLMAEACYFQEEYPTTRLVIATPFPLSERHPQQKEIKPRRYPRNKAFDRVDYDVSVVSGV